MNQQIIDEYQQHYDKLPFEETMAAIRKKMLLAFLQKYKPAFIAEVGCGNESIVDYYNEYKQAIVVEPSKAFFQRLVQRHEKVEPGKNIFINDFFSETLCIDCSFPKLDAIVISGILHEVEKPEMILSAAHKLCDDETIVHVNVPNAYSMHRLLAFKGGMIKSLKEKSASQILLNQPHTFDMDDLKRMASNAGFKIVDDGSYFIKPFTHEQMEILRNHEKFGEKIIDGLEKLIFYLPNFGAEIFINLRKRK